MEEKSSIALGNVVEGTTASFMSEVIEASKQHTVLVDFYADWCGPCKQLTPILRDVAAQLGNDIKLVLLNIDTHPEIPGQLGIRSVPTVVAFIDGKPANAFAGAKTSAEVLEFAQTMIASHPMTGANLQIEEHLTMAKELLDAGNATGAADIYTQILQADDGNIDAIIGLAEVRLALQQADMAAEVLSMVPQEKRNNPAYLQVMARVALAQGSQNGEADDLRMQLNSDPDNLLIKHDLAAALAGAGQEEEAIDLLLAIYKADREWEEAKARLKLLEIFDALGPKSPVANAGRRRLSSLMFS